MTNGRRDPVAWAWRCRAPDRYPAGRIGIGICADNQFAATLRAFRSIGWTWGGVWRSLKDYMHFSANGL